MILPDDLRLFAAIQKGDESAFNIFFTKYYPMLCAYAERYVDAGEAEEIVQSVMVWLWENRETQTFEISVVGYLSRMVKNKCLTLIYRDERKRNAKKIFYEQHQLIDNTDFYVLEELMKNIDHAIDELPDNYKEAFKLNRFKNMTYKGIARKLDISSKTVDYRIQQALRILRIKLKDYL